MVLSVFCLQAKCSTAVNLKDFFCMQMSNIRQLSKVYWRLFLMRVLNLFALVAF